MPRRWVLSRVTLRHPGTPLAIGAVAWVIVAAVAVSRAHGAAATPAAGLDLRPVRDAGLALRAGRPIYAIKAFVYPPPAVLLGLAESYVSFHRAVTLYSYFEVAAIALTVLLFRRCLAPARWQLLASAVVAGILLKGDVVVSDLWLDNASVLLLLPCACLLLRWGGGRWRSGAILLGLSYLLKPVLAPLLVIPPTFRRWKALALIAAIAVVGFFASLPLTGDPGALLKVASRLGGGSNLVGRASVYNISLAGIANTHHVSFVLATAIRVLIVGSAVLVVVYVVRQDTSPSLVVVGSMSGLLLSTLFLAGPLSEGHYLFFLIPGAMTAVAAPVRLARYLLLAAFVLAGYSAYYFHGVGESPTALQIRFVLIELLVFAASVLVLALASRARLDETPMAPTPMASLRLR